MGGLVHLNELENLATKPEISSLITKLFVTRKHTIYNLLLSSLWVQDLETIKYYLVFAFIPQDIDTTFWPSVDPMIINTNSFPFLHFTSNVDLSGATLSVSFIFVPILMLAPILFPHPLHDRWILHKLVTLRFGAVCLWAGLIWVSTKVEKQSSYDRAVFSE